MNNQLFAILLTTTLAITISNPTLGKDIPSTSPDKVGVSSERLKRLTELADKYINESKYSGIVTLVARDGKIIHEHASGSVGVDDDRSMQTDSLFRIYSMTKPITAVAALILYERGLFHLDDPLAKYLPEFAEQKILIDGELLTPQSPVTIRQLFTHTSGMSYGWTADNPVDLQYQKAKLFESENLAEFTTKLAQLPLRYQPDTRYHYSVSYDVLGVLIERLSGQTLDDFFRTEIFEPLEMSDTFFEVPTNKLQRLVNDQAWNYEMSQMVKVPDEQSRRFDKVELFIGGGGLVSTAEDYLRFCQMILNQGALNDARILSPKTIEMMSGNHLTDTVRANGVGEYPSLDLYNGQSMALGFGVVTIPQLMPDLSSIGELSWGGIAGTKFWIDPKEKLVGIAFVQQYQSPWPLRSDMKTAVYQALDELY